MPGRQGYRVLTLWLIPFPPLPSDDEIVQILIVLARQVESTLVDRPRDVSAYVDVDRCDVCGAVGRGCRDLRTAIPVYGRT
jgi:hypothetical protein